MTQHFFFFYKKRKPVLKEKTKTSLKEKLYQKKSESEDKDDGLFKSGKGFRA
jgi:hypothetical protein